MGPDDLVTKAPKATVFKHIFGLDWSYQLSTNVFQCAVIRPERL